MPTSEPTHPADEPLPFGALVQITKLLVRLATGAGVLCGLAAAATIWLQATSGMPADAATALRTDCVFAGIAAAVVAMFSAGIYGGAVSRREEIARERARAAAERERQERRREREAAEAAAAQREAELRAAAERAAEEARLAAEARTAERREKEEEDPVARAIREREQEELIARLREEAARRAKEEKVERAILTGTRAA